jgi:hypothetical protein
MPILPQRLEVAVHTVHEMYPTLHQRTDQNILYIAMDHLDQVRDKRDGVEFDNDMESSTSK